MKMSKNKFESVYGAVIVYTRRHINGCKLRDRKSLVPYPLFDDRLSLLKTF